MSESFNPGEKIEKTLENPNKEYVLDFVEWRLTLRDKKDSDINLPETTSWLNYTPELKNIILSNDHWLTFEWELWQLLSMLKSNGDNRIAGNNPVFWILMLKWELEMEIKVLQDKINKMD